MEQLKVLFLSIILFLAINKNDARKKKTSEDSPSSRSGKSIEYYVYRELKDFHIDYAHELMARQTCLNFTKKNFLSTETTVFKWGFQCSANAELVNGKVRYFVNINEDCNRRDMILRLIFWSAMMRYQLKQCIQSNGIEYSNKTSNDKIMNLISFYDCEFENPDDTDIKIYDNLLTFTNVKNPKISGIKYKNLEQKDYSTEISFSDIEYLNGKICGESCGIEHEGQCEHFGYPNPKNCDTCVCPFFYEGKRCEKFMEPKRPYLCGSSLLEARGRRKTRVLNLNVECYRKIMPLRRDKKIRITFKPTETFYWDCKEHKLIEIKYIKDKSRVGLIPCGRMDEFTVTADVGENVLVYNSRIAHESKFIIEYKTISA